MVYRNYDGQSRHERVGAIHRSLQTSALYVPLDSLPRIGKHEAGEHTASNAKASSLHPEGQVIRIMLPGRSCVSAPRVWFRHPRCLQLSWRRKAFNDANQHNGN